MPAPTFIYFSTKDYIKKICITDLYKNSVPMSHVYKSRETNSLKHFKLSPKGKTVAILEGTNPQICLYNLENFNLISEIYTSHIINWLEFSNDGKILACGTDDGYILIYDIDPIKF